MNKKIYKYPLHTDDKQAIEVPRIHKILTLQMQGTIPTLWIEVDDDSIDSIDIHIEIYGTGHTINPSNDPYDREYIGTYQERGGLLVWHVYRILI